MTQPAFEIAGQVIAAGEARRIDLPAAWLPTHTPVPLSVTVSHGLKSGPRVFLSAAVHGDELNGVEVIRRVLDAIPQPLARGTLMAIPIVNVFGFLNQSRYMPDRRDLNRAFPGSKRGSLASRIAHLFMTEVVDRSTHGIDLHTASNERTNLPQVRGDLANPELRRMATAFGAPAMLHAPIRNGSLRGAAGKRGVPVLVYEAGGPQRFEEHAISTGVRGVQSVLRTLGMLSGRKRPKPSVELVDSSWCRARRGGLLRLDIGEGAQVAKHQILGRISDPLGEKPVNVRSPHDGIVIGFTKNPIVHEGDAVVHVGRFGSIEH